jgi:hypothetical protein
VEFSRSKAPLVLVVVAGLALGACGGGSSGQNATAGPPLQVVRTAATTTAAGGTARAAVSMGADFSDLSFGGKSKPSSGTAAVTATGAFDLAAKRGRLDVDLSHLPTTLKGGVPGRHLSVLIDQTTVYVQAAGLGISSPKPWIKFDAPSSQDGSFDLTQLAQAGPSQGLALLQQLGDVTVVGQDQVRGAQTTHYRAKLDLGKALTAFGSGGSGGLFGGTGQGLNSLGGAMAPVDVWIDGAGRLRKMTVALDLLPLLRAFFGVFAGLASQFGQAGGTAPTLPANAKALINLSFELYDFGAKVDVAPPPADQVGPPPAGFKLPSISLPGTSSSG